MGKQKLPFLFCLCLKLSKTFTKCFIAVNSKHRVKLFIGAVWEITGSHFLTSSCVLSCSWLRYKVYFLFMYTFTTGKGINKLQDNIESVSDIAIVYYVSRGNVSSLTTTEQARVEGLQCVQVLYFCIAQNTCYSFSRKSKSCSGNHVRDTRRNISLRVA